MLTFTKRQIYVSQQHIQCQKPLFYAVFDIIFYDLDKVLTFANFHGDQNVIDDGGNIQCIYFYMPKLAPVSAIGRTGYSGTNKRFWHNRYRFP